MSTDGAGGWPPPGTGRGLPGWARDMAGQYPAYAFAPCKVSRGRAVAAVRTGPGTGPNVVITSLENVVITSLEEEMRDALGGTSQPPAAG